MYPSVIKYDVLGNLPFSEMIFPANETSSHGSGISQPMFDSRHGQRPQLPQGPPK